VSVTELAREATELAAGEIAARGVRVRIAEDLPAVSVDRARIVEVLQNLISNAVRFMGEQRDPWIEISAGVGEGEVVCRVRDNGIGIEPQHHERVFGLFQRLDADGDGTGMGLAIARRTLEVHGGRIWVESDGRGAGSVFCFSLPTRPRPE
jgi:signal transduction histidine kinase